MDDWVLHLSDKTQVVITEDGVVCVHRPCICVSGTQAILQKDAIGSCWARLAVATTLNCNAYARSFFCTEMSSTVFAFLLVLTTLGASATPLQEFFQRIQNKPLLTYQCYRNGTSFEPDTAQDLRILWTSAGENKADCVVEFNMPGVEEKTSFRGTAEYVPDKDMAILADDKRTAQLYVLQPPYNGEAYYFKQIITATGHQSFKIYDTSQTCENAMALRQTVCTDPCNLKDVQ